MVAYQGQVVNGRIVLDGGVSLPDGLRVRIEPVATKSANGQGSVFDIGSMAVDTGIKDLASQHDHYASGAPKRPAA
jgi:hypothetical protein